MVNTGSPTEPSAAPCSRMHAMKRAMRRHKTALSEAPRNLDRHSTKVKHTTNTTNLMMGVFWPHLNASCAIPRFHPRLYAPGPFERHTIVSEEFFTNIRYQLRLNCGKPLAVHLTVDFMPVTDCVKLTSFQCSLLSATDIFQEYRRSLLRLPDCTKTHTCRRDADFTAVLGFSCHCGARSSVHVNHFSRYRSTQPSNRPSRGYRKFSEPNQA